MNDGPRSASASGPGRHGTAPPALSLRLLGKPQVYDDNGRRWRDLAKKGAALLAMLAIDGPVSREAIATQLWPAADGEKPRVNLRGLLRDLRSLSGRDLVLGADVLELAGTVQHDLDPSSELPPTPGAAAQLLGSHDYAELEEFDDWLRGARERQAGLRRQRWLDRCTQHERSSRLQEAIINAQHLVDDDPLEEAAYRLLMRLHYQQGDRVAALAVLARCRAALQSALAAEPSAATRALATLIESGEPLPFAPARPTPIDRSKPLRLVAREGECRQITLAWSAGQAVWLEGEAGIGKSRLLSHLAESTATVLVGVLQGDAESPYAALGRVLLALQAWSRPLLPPDVRAELARLRPEFGQAPTRPARTFRLADALRRSLLAWQGAGLRTLLVDDLHWADAASQRLLLDAASALPATPGLSLLFSCRPMADAPAPDTPRWQRLTLRPLSADGVAQLLHGVPGLPPGVDQMATELAEQAAGNPFFVLEAVHAMRGGRAEAADRQAARDDPAPAAPPTVAALLTARLARLDGAALRLARLAALAGAAFDARLATQVLGEAPLALADAWSSLEAEAVLHDGRLAHDNLRPPLLAAMPEPLARELHAAVAAASADRAEPAEQARHWFAAQHWAHAAKVFGVAARRAKSQDAGPGAVRLCDRAADCHERVGEHEAAFAARVEAFDMALAVLPLADAGVRAAWLEQGAESNDQRLDAALALARCAATYQFSPPCTCRRPQVRRCLRFLL